MSWPPRGSFSTGAHRCAPPPGGRRDQAAAVARSALCVRREACARRYGRRRRGWLASKLRPRGVAVLALTRCRLQGGVVERVVDGVDRDARGNDLVDAIQHRLVKDDV